MNKDDSAFKNEFSLNNVTSWEQIKRTEKVFWICSQGHDYEQSLFNRLKGYKCPYCAGKKILVGFNDLASTHPEVADEWHPSLNTEFTIHTISKGSTKKVWWLGSVCGHSWLMSPNSRTASKQGCAVCSGSQIIESKSVLSTHPELIKEWSDKNDASLDSVSFGSKKKFIWLCPMHGEYIASVQTKAKGHGCYRCGKIATGLYRRTPDIKNSVGSLFPELYDLLDTSFHDVNELEKYKAGSNFVLHWVCVKGHKYESAIHTQVSALKAVTKGCGKCWVPSTSSTMEKELADFLVQLSVDNNFNIIAKDRKILEGKELDFYIPEKNIAVEFNGLYWHSEANGKGKYYHYDKWKKCKDKGIQLIQVWEDDWVSKSVFVKRMLSRKLNVSSDSKVFARKTYVKSLIADDVEDFLSDNHIQGFVSGSYYLGLVDKVSDRLVAVLVLKKEFVSSGVVLHIVRYATSVNVVGGFTKLLKYAELEYKPLSFVTFADNCVSDGGLYENNGFVVDKELKPDYMYVVKKERKHKFGFRLKKFRNDESLVYVDGLTEKELSLLNNMSRIWDAGKVRYVKMVSS